MSTMTAKPQSSQPAGAAAHTIGSELQSSPAIDAAVEQIVREVQARSARLTDIRPASAALKESYDSYLKRAGETRGRGLLYPYLGSGIGNGALVELMDGSVKWDMICGIGVYFFGHSDADQIRTAVKASLNDTLQHGNLQSGWEPYEFSEALLKFAGRGSKLKHCYSTTSGCMANENALKVCYQKHAPASRVIAFKDCFMGRSVTMSQIGDAAANRIGIPLSTHVDYMPFYDEAAAKRMSSGDQSGATRYIDMCVSHLRQYVERYPRQHACFIFEFVQGEGGFNTAPREFFVELIKVCKDSKIAVWDDEIQTFGRTTSMFAYEQSNLGEFVDVFCIGKMTQACATLFTEEYNPGPGLLSGTFTSSTVAFRQGTRVLERLDEGNNYGQQGAFARHYAAFSKGVRDIATRHPEWFPGGQEYVDIVGGTGGMMKFTPFGGKKEKVVKACKHLFDAGVVVFYCGHGPYHIRMLPPLGVFNEQDWPRVMKCIEQGLAACAAEV
jgi:acetylornithine/N-succinyldiaminopimelate aminotransferase